MDIFEKIRKIPFINQIRYKVFNQSKSYFFMYISKMITLLKIKLKAIKLHADIQTTKREPATSFGYFKEEKDRHSESIKNVFKSK